MSRAVTALALAASAAATLCAQDVVLPDGKAKTLVQNSCSECHGLDQVVGNTMSRDDWRATVTRMVRRGATLSPAEIDSVVDYLAVYFSPEPAAHTVNVNTAAAKDIQSALGITEAQAGAVVAWRTKNGKIADLSGLAKAAGVDVKAFDAAKDKIVF